MIVVDLLRCCMTPEFITIHMIIESMLREDSDSSLSADKISEAANPQEADGTETSILRAKPYYLSLLKVWTVNASTMALVGKTFAALLAYLVT